MKIYIFFFFMVVVSRAVRVLCCGGVFFHKVHESWIIRFT